MKYLVISFLILLKIVFAVDEIDQRPGSRSLYVNKIDEETLSLCLRKCTCDLKESNDSDIKSFCRCWEDFNHEDYPYIQGRACNFVIIANKFNKLFLGFDVTFYQDENKLELNIPTPKRLKEICHPFNIDYFEIFEEKEERNSDAYLKALSKGKMVLPTPNLKGKDQNLAYQPYLHVVFNVFFFWIALPEHLRVLIKDRAEGFVNIFDKLELKFKDNKVSLSILKLLKHYSVLNFHQTFIQSNEYLMTDKFIMPNEDKKIRACQQN